MLQVLLCVTSVGYIVCYVYRFVLVSEIVEFLRSTYYEQFISLAFLTTWDEVSLSIWMVSISVTHFSPAICLTLASFCLAICFTPVCACLSHSHVCLAVCPTDVSVCPVPSVWVSVSFSCLSGHVSVPLMSVWLPHVSVPLAELVGWLPHSPVWRSVPFCVSLGMCPR